MSLSVIGLKEQQLGDHRVGDIVIDGRARKLRSFNTAIDIVGALAAAGLFNTIGMRT